MKGLTVIVADRSSERFRTALALAAANAALGGRTRIFCQGEAVAVLRPPIRGVEDDMHADVGLPVLAELFTTALDLGVEITACQSGLDLTHIDARTIDPRIAFGGLVGTMQTLGEDRLVVV